MYKRTFVLVLSILFVLGGCKGQNRTSGDVGSSSTGGGGGSGGLPPPTYFTVSVPINGTTNVTKISWNLGTQMSGSSPLPGGGTFTISVQIVNSPTGQPTYNFTLPTITGGAAAILCQNVGFIINGQQISTATTYNGVNRMIPASPANRVLSSSTEVIPMTTSPSDTIAMTFGNLAPTVFNPPTYTQLKSTSGVFGGAAPNGNCISCHSTANPQGGLDLTNYSSLISGFQAVPFLPNDSYIIKRMTGGSSPQGSGYMPPSGTLGGSYIQQVSDWISDGAPNN